MPGTLRIRVVVACPNMKYGGPQFRRLLIFTVALLVVSSAANARGTALDLDGHAVNPLAVDSGKVVVMIFVRRDCPVSSRYAPAIQQISMRFGDGVRFWLVFPDKSESADAIRKYRNDYGYRIPALRDGEHTLVKLAHVQITPEVAVFDRNHQLVYDGRIDDRYVDLGKVRPVPTTHELEDAIGAAVAGKPVARAEVRGVGCYISDLE